jgi:hypothetical protein
MTDIKSNAKPIEVWLSQPNIEITCRVVFEDESADELSVGSLSMRGAQREMTSWLIGQGYEPSGRWSDEDGEGRETMRRFRRTGPDHITRARVARNESGGATPGIGSPAPVAQAAHG